MNALTIARFTIQEAISRRLIVAGALASLLYIGLFALGRPAEQAPLLAVVQQREGQREQDHEGDAERHAGEQQPAPPRLQHGPARHDQEVHCSRTSPTRSTKTSSRDRCTGTSPYSR